MQNSVVQQNVPQQSNYQPQVNNSAQYQTAPVQTPQVPQSAQMMQPTTMTQPAQQPLVQQPLQQAQMQQPQNQNVQVPNYSGVNIQIFNPSVTPPGATAPVYNVNAPNYGSTPATGCYPPSYYTQPMGQPLQASNNTNTENKTNDKKTEKREIVELTDDYIRTLENYLNNQDKEVRLMGAKEVIARLDEDHSRKDDKALNALVNKMLQDPSASVRTLALTALNSRIATGDNLSVNLLQQMQNSQSGYGQDALMASDTLLKMSGQTTEKEFEVKNNPKKTESEKK